MITAMNESSQDTILTATARECDREAEMKNRKRCIWYILYSDSTGCSLDDPLAGLLSKFRSSHPPNLATYIHTGIYQVV